MNDVLNLPDAFPEKEEENDFTLVRNISIGLAVYVFVVFGISYLLSSSSGSSSGSGVIHTATDKIFLLMSQPAKGTITFSAHDQKTEKFTARFEKADWLKRILSSDHVAISPDGTILAACLTASSNSQYQLITVNVKTGKIIHENYVKCEQPSFTSDNKLIYIQNDAENGWKIVFEGKKEFTSEKKVHSPQYSDAHKRVLYIDDELKGIYSYDPESGLVSAQVGAGFTKINGMLLSPNGEKIALSVDDQSITIISAKSGKKLRSMEILDLVKFSWSTDNEHIYYMHGVEKKSIKSVDTSVDYSPEEVVLTDLNINTTGMWRSY